MIRCDEIKAKVKIKNMPKQLLSCGYIVARQYITAEEPELWFYGMYESKKRAKRAAVEIGNGVLLEIEGEKPVKLDVEEAVKRFSEKLESGYYEDRRSEHEGV